MAPFKSTMCKKNVCLILCLTMIKKLPFHTFLGDLKTPTSRLETFSQQLTLKDKFKTGIWPLESVSVQWRTRLHMLTLNYIASISIMTAQSYWLLEVNRFWGFMMKSRGKRNLNWKSQMLLTIVIPTESFAPNLTEIHNSSISFTVVVGIQPS